MLVGSAQDARQYYEFLCERGLERRWKTYIENEIEAHRVWHFLISIQIMLLREKIRSGR